MVDRQTFVVGFDASEESDRALTWARSAAAEHDQIRVVHAWEIPVVTGYDVIVAVDIGEAEQIAKQALAEMVERLDDDRIAPVLCRGHAGRAIVEEGATADVVVVGHRGNSRLSLMLGSTANYVLHHAEVPVVVVRGDEAGVPPRRVVVGVDDFSDPSDNPSVRALQWAMRLPGVEQVTALHAWFLPPLAVGVYHPATTDLEAMDDAAHRVAERVVASAGPAPADVALIAAAARGSGGSALIAASHEADLVVVGSRGRGGFSELLLGSTTAETAAHSHAPVAVIR